MSVLDQIVYLANQAKQQNQLPIKISNKDLPLIEESALIIAALEFEGFKVETFAEPLTQTYGVKVS